MNDKSKDRPIFPRLISGSVVQIKGHVFKVSFWYPKRMYEFESKTTHSRWKTEQEVADLIKANRVIVINDGLDLAFEKKP